MGACACYGVKMIVIGAILAANDQGWLWTPLSAWLLVGILLVVLGGLKVAMPVCPVHCKAPMPAKVGKKK